jgi:hypothetical protein
MIWAVVGGFVLLVVGLAAFFLRSNGNGGDRLRATDDGFFVRGFPSGSRIFWRARVNGTMRDGTAELVGDETFVYTGGTPTDIAIKNLGGALAPVMGPVSSGPPSSDDDGDSGFGGFPSAY